jgi:hypothetical protein
MSTTITIPAQLVPGAREVTVFTLGLAGEEIWTQSQKIRNCELDAALERFDTIRGLLDAIGSAQGAVDVDEIHKPILIELMADQARSVGELLNEEREAGRADEVERCEPRVKNLTTYTAALSEAGA